MHTIVVYVTDYSTSHFLRSYMEKDVCKMLQKQCFPLVQQGVVVILKKVEESDFVAYDGDPSC